jgi:hypothetical protein
MTDDAPPAPGASPEGDEALPLLKLAAALARDLPGVVTDRIRLLSLEVRRAGLALAQMVALGLVAGILCATAWIALWVGVAVALIQAGLAWPWICALVVVVNLGAAAWAASRARALAPLLALPATLRRLTDADSRERAAGDRFDRDRGEREHGEHGQVRPEAARPAP